jgi:hypothetical protein
VFPQDARPEREAPKQPLFDFRPSTESQAFHEPRRSRPPARRPTEESDRTPRRISRPYSTYRTEGLPSGIPHPTQPHPRGLVTSSARYSPPNLPAILQTGALMGFHPSEPFPPSGAAPDSSGRCRHAVHHAIHLRRLERRAAASRLCSPLESDTARQAFTPSGAETLLGLCPSEVLSPPAEGPCGPTLMPLERPAAEADRRPRATGRYPTRG